MRSVVLFLLRHSVDELSIQVGNWSVLEAGYEVFYNLVMAYTYWGHFASGPVPIDKFERMSVRCVDSSERVSGSTEHDATAVSLHFPAGLSNPPHRFHPSRPVLRGRIISRSLGFRLPQLARSPRLSHRDTRS